MKSQIPILNDQNRFGPPKAEALFPGNRLPAIALAQARRAGLPAREKTPSSVISVPLW
jgi:hypothetical protein